MNTTIWIYDFFNLPFSALEHQSCPFAGSCFAAWDSPVVFASPREALCFIVSALLFMKVVWPVLTFATDDEDCTCYFRWGQCLLWQHSLLFLLGRSCLVHFLITFAFLSFLSYWELMVLWDQYETKGLFCIVTFSSFVSSAQVNGTFFFFICHHWKH